MTQHSPVLSTANISWQNGALYNQDFNDYYYSQSDGLAESTYVFVKGNQLPQRWLEFENNKSTEFSIIETGFGSGLNFFNTAEHWLRFRKEQKPKHLKKLNYTSIEGFPLTQADLSQIINTWNYKFSATGKFLQHYPPAIKGIYGLDFDTVKLNLIFMPLDKALAQFEPKGSSFFDCLYLDGFAPNRNESMWTSSLLRQISYFCKLKSTFSTFTSASAVRKSLINIGYKVQKIKGHGSKREMLMGDLENCDSSKYRSKTPWFEFPTSNRNNQNIAIIGAGIVGCATAYSLARLGITSTLIDNNNEPGGTIKDFKASSYSPYFSADFNPISQLYWLAYHRLEQYLQQHSNVDHQKCGIFYIANNSQRFKALKSVYKLVKAGGLNLQWIEPDQTQTITGIKIHHPGLFNPNGGWVNVKSLCESFICQSPISVKFDTEVLRIERNKNSWLIHTSTDTYSFASVILCGGAGLSMIEDYQLCQLDRLHGQLTAISNSNNLSALKTIINNGQYLIPQHHNNELLVGSNYERSDSNSSNQTVNADIENLSAVKDLNDDLNHSIKAEMNQLAKHNKSHSIAGIRLSSRDHLPIIGPVPDILFYKENYPEYIKSNRLKGCPMAKYIEGLLINTAHGSRGVTASLLAGEIIAALVTKQQYPIPTNLYHAVHPARFFVRDTG